MKERKNTEVFHKRVRKIRYKNLLKCTRNIWKFCIPFYIRNFNFYITNAIYISLLMKMQYTTIAFKWMIKSSFSLIKLFTIHKNILCVSFIFIDTLIVFNLFCRNNSFNVNTLTLFVFMCGSVIKMLLDTNFMQISVLENLDFIETTNYLNDLWDLILEIWPSSLKLIFFAVRMT